MLVLPRPIRSHLGNPDLARLAAQKFVESHGTDALGILGERAEMAAELGHPVAARTWRDLAEIAAAILRTSCSARPDALAAKSAAWRNAIAKSRRQTGRL